MTMMKSKFILWSSLLLPFSAMAGEASLSCQAPTLNDDGTPLTDLTNYKVYYGTESGVYTETQQFPADECAFLIEDLATGRWYFVATAINSTGKESVYSNEVFKDIEPPAPNPPFGLTVEADNTVAYLLSISDDVVVPVPVGFVDAGVACDVTTSFNNLNRVDIADVHYVGTVRPPVVFAECSGG